LEGRPDVCPTLPKTCRTLPGLRPFLLLRQAWRADQWSVRIDVATTSFKRIGEFIHFT